MQRLLAIGLVLTVCSAPVFAVGLDRSGQGIGIIFETEDMATFSFGHVRPSVAGEGTTPFTGATGNLTGSYNQVGFALRKGISDRLSLAVVVDEPYGSDLVYPTSGNSWLSGTKAILDSRAFTAISRYKIDENISFHGGLRYQTIATSVVLKGAIYAGAFGPDGYKVDFAKKGELGYVIGTAYERPEIALRVALTYNSEINYDVDTVERVGGGVFNSVTRIKTPAAVNLDFQTGVAAGTLVFGSIRYAKYADTIVRPNGLGGASLTNFTNGSNYSIGMGRQFSEKFSGFAAFAYEPAGSGPTKSPLSPTNGVRTVTIGAGYQVSNAVKVSGGISYSKLGGTTVAEGPFKLNSVNNSSATGVGIQVAYKF